MSAVLALSVTPSAASSVMTPVLAVMPVASEIVPADVPLPAV